MSKFLSYPKIHRLGKEETEGILDREVTIQEKVDGANVSIWLDEGEVKGGSRTRTLKDDESFNGFVEALKSNYKIEEWLSNNPTKRLYAEWLVKHTITYPDAAYRKIYLYDVYDDKDQVFLSQTKVEELAKSLGLEYPQVFIANKKVTEEEIKEYVGRTLVPDAARGEGVVIKAQDFVDKWGNHCYAKLVHEQFKEANAIVFGGNNKHSDSYQEMYVVNKYCTLGRVQKIINKLQPEVNHKLDLKDIPEIAGRCVHDMITEEAWEIFNKGTVIDNRKLKRLATKKYIQIYKDILDNSISVADNV